MADETHSFVESTRDFYHAYGAAMASWAEIESSMGYYFEKIGNLEPNLAHAVYYSARSFLGRADMLSASIPFAKTVPDGRKFLMEVVKLTRGWSSVRNMFAHDIHRITFHAGRSTPFMTIRSPDGSVVEIGQVETAANNFFMLSMLLIHARGATKLLREPELCLEALKILPTDPLSSGADRKVLASLQSRIQQSSD